MATFSMKQLSEKTGVPARTIRYHISRGLLPGAVGKGRRAHYTEEHLERLLEVERHLNAGVSL